MAGHVNIPPRQNRGRKALVRRSVCWPSCRTRRLIVGRCSGCEDHVTTGQGGPQMSHDMFEPNVEEFGARYPALMLADIGDAEFYARLVAGTRHVLRYHRADSCDRIAD